MGAARYIGQAGAPACSDPWGLEGLFQAGTTWPAALYQDLVAPEEKQVSGVESVCRGYLTAVAH